MSQSEFSGESRGEPELTRPTIRKTPSCFGDTDLVDYLGTDVQMANLSKRRLKEDEELVLKLGLKFISMPPLSHTSSAPQQILYDVQSTFERYIFYKISTLTLAQRAIIRNVFWDIRKTVKKLKSFHFVQTSHKG